MPCSPTAWFPATCSLPSCLELFAAVPLLAAVVVAAPPEAMVAVVAAVVSAVVPELFSSLEQAAAMRANASAVPTRPAERRPTRLRLVGPTR